MRPHMQCCALTFALMSQPRTPKALDELPQWVSKLFDDALDQWRGRARREKEIEDGSSLAAEDGALPGASGLTWVALCSGVNHLTALRSLWRTTKRLHVFADPTLLRAALLAASTAVYYLDASPGVDRRERLRRLALGKLADADDRLRAARLSLDLAFALGYDAADELRYRDAVQEEYDDAASVAQAFGATRAQRGGPLPANLCVKVAAEVTARKYPPSMRQAVSLAYRLAWQIGSADAHSRLWQVLARLAKTSNPSRAPIEPDLDQSLAILHAAADVLNHGWLLWQLRSVNHAALVARHVEMPPLIEGALRHLQSPERAASSALGPVGHVGSE